MFYRYLASRHQLIVGIEVPKTFELQFIHSFAIGSLPVPPLQFRLTLFMHEIERKRRRGAEDIRIRIGAVAPWRVCPSFVGTCIFVCLF